MNDQKNLILAIALSLAILLGFQYFFEGPRTEKARQQQALDQQQKQAQAVQTAPNGAPIALAPTGAPSPTTPAGEAKPPALTRAAALALAPRIKIEARRLRGSISLVGGRLDDLTLADYRLEVDRSSPEIVLLSPAGAPEPYWSEFGLTAAPDAGVKLPDANTLWQTDNVVLRFDQPVTLKWDNGQGLRFSRRFAIDENFLFTVTQKVENATEQPVTLFPFGLIVRQGTPPTQGFYILHEGPLGVFRDKTEDGGKLTEMSYSDVVDKRSIELNSTGGWIGITDKYWLTALVPAADAAVRARFSYTGKASDRFQTDYLGSAIEAPARASVEAQGRLFAGAKEVLLIDAYQDRYTIARFDRAIDWGWFYFLTRPIFFAIDYFNRLLGNFGLAILLLTIIIKFLFLPLAYKSYVSMSAMKKLQPEMLKLRERHAQDPPKLQQEMMAMYKREKINPAAGCLPILLQIPVFFALYKVLFTTIEMRHAPFYGWIRDLSAPDPTTILNLFGLLPWARMDLGPLDFLNLGVWPIVMGISMWLQMRLNPQPPDPIQARLFSLMPIMFTFLLASFPAGLVIYWTWNNILSMAQQMAIMKHQGVKT